MRGERQSTANPGFWVSSKYLLLYLEIINKQMSTVNFSFSLAFLRPSYFPGPVQSELDDYHFRAGLTSQDVDDVSLVYDQLQDFTHNLCRGSNSLPVLAVELQNNCHLLQVIQLSFY